MTGSVGRDAVVGLANEELDDLKEGRDQGVRAQTVVRGKTRPQCLEEGLEEFRVLYEGWRENRDQRQERRVRGDVAVKGVAQL